MDVRAALLKGAAQALWMSIVIANKAFSLIHVLPETVVSWFGGHWRGQMGNFDNETKGAILSAVGMTRGMSGKGMGLGRQGLRDRIFNERNNKTPAGGTDSQ